MPLSGLRIDLPADIAEAAQGWGEHNELSGEEVIG